jgi:hypothetical protein
MSTGFEIERRKAPRRDLGRPARLKPNDWSSIEVEVVNFSTDGFRARCEAVLRIGSYVSIQIPGIGSVQAKIVWNKAGEFGAKFVQPIDPRYCGWFGAEAPGAAAEEAEALESVAALLAKRVEMRIAGAPAEPAPGGSAEANF